MQLLLLQPGNTDFFGGLPDWNVNTNLAAALADDWKTLSKLSGPLGHCVILTSVGQGMTQTLTTNPGSGARTTGRPALTDIACSKLVDENSPKMNDYCLRAVPLGQGADQPTLLYLASQLPDGVVSLQTIALRDALISELQRQTQPDGSTTEQFKLNFTEILWSYSALAGGNQLGKTSSGWSITLNRPIGAFTT